MSDEEPTPERPRYRVFHDGERRNTGFTVVCDEGWCTSIVCEGMYEWAADWLVGVLQGRPYAPETRP